MNGSTRHVDVRGWSAEMREIELHGLPCALCGHPAVGFVPGIGVRHVGTVCQLELARQEPVGRVRDVLQDRPRVRVSAA